MADRGADRGLPRGGIWDLEGRPASCRRELARGERHPCALGSQKRDMDARRGDDSSGPGPGLPRLRAGSGRRSYLPERSPSGRGAGPRAHRRPPRCRPRRHRATERPPGPGSRPESAPGPLPSRRARADRRHPGPTPGASPAPRDLARPDSDHRRGPGPPRGPGGPGNARPHPDRDHRRRPRISPGTEASRDAGADRHSGDPRGHPRPGGGDARRRGDLRPARPRPPRTPMETI